MMSKGFGLGHLGCGCLASLLTVFVVLLFLIALGIGLATVKKETDGEVAVDDRIPELELVSAGESDDDDVPCVLRVRLSGEITFEREEGLLAELNGASPAEIALRHICAAERDEEIAGILLELDSPGGEVTASDEIWHALRKFRESRKNRFVLVHAGSLCCSGAYYIAAAADRIMLRPTTMTGSIGVILSAVNAAELAKKIGVESVNITSGSNKALLDPLKPVAPEHVDILKRALMADYDRFVEIVASGRKMPQAKVRALADGRIFSAQDAVKEGLADSIGYREDARRELCKLAKAKSVGIYRYKGDRSLAGLLPEALFSECVRRIENRLFSRLAEPPRLRHLYR